MLGLKCKVRKPNEVSIYYKNAVKKEYNIMSFISIEIWMVIEFCYYCMLFTRLGCDNFQRQVPE